MRKVYPEYANKNLDALHSALGMNGDYNEDPAILTSFFEAPVHVALMLHVLDPKSEYFLVISYLLLGGNDDPDDSNLEIIHSEIFL